MTPVTSSIVTDYRLNANHNRGLTQWPLKKIVTDYRLNANHNLTVQVVCSKIL
ncbi:Helicase loader DnaI [uncultured Gammaproteobacteria bacterium]|nr:Helicase loader DnaI [uncultured Gammaproteobacteria bacterium]